MTHDGVNFGSKKKDKFLSINKQVKLELTICIEVYPKITLYVTLYPS